MSQLSAEDEAELQSLLKQLLISINDRISAAPSAECAEQILLHLEETDKNFHNYEFVKYLRHHVESSLGGVVEEETRNMTRGEAQHHAIGSGYDTLIHAVTRRTRESTQYGQMMQSLKSTMTMVVESLVTKFEEDQLRKEEELQRERQHSQSHSHFMDNCSDSDSSFNQSYAFIRQEQLQVLAEKLDVSKPKEVRWQALMALCCAPPSDVLSCESWSSLRRKLCAALTEPDTDISDKVLQFFAKSFSSSPLNVTREIYTSLAKTVESSFWSQKLKVPTGSAPLDINRPEITRLLKQIRLMNDFQKEVTTFWIRHPEKYMEEVIESTFSLLALLHQDPGSTAPGPEPPLEPVHLLALLDIKASWFNKWMHGYYSRTVVLRLLEHRYKSLIAAALQQCLRYGESQRCAAHTHHPRSIGQPQHNTVQRSVYSAEELDYAVFVHSLSFLGKLLIYTNGRKLFPVKVKKHTDLVGVTDLLVILIHIMYQHPEPAPGDASHTDSLSPSALVMEVLWTLCERTESAADCLHHPTVIQTLLSPVIALLNGQECKLKSPSATLTLVADILARIANTERGLALFLQEREVAQGGESSSAALVIVRFTLQLLTQERFPPLGEPSPVLRGAFILVCRQVYNTCEGLQVLRPLGLHAAIAAAWKKVSSLSEATPKPGASGQSQSAQELQGMRLWEETLLDSLLNFAATPRGLLLLAQTGATAPCVSYMFSRFTRKLQVSRCEKFGYGVMVTQVAATAPGVAALRSSGFVRALVMELWSTLECGSEDVRVVRPKATPMEPIDRSCLKSFLSLVNLLSSPRSVWELLARQPLANKSQYSLREMPTSVPDLIDRLIAVDSEAKIHSLFHYEQTHTFGLRLLSVLCSSLDSFLLLESQYHISSVLLEAQRDNRTQAGAGHGEFIIDGLSLERNHVLVRVSVVGGPSERQLPPRALQEGEDPYPWPMFCALPPPACFTLRPPDAPPSAQDCEMTDFLASDTESETSWMETCRQHYSRVMTSDPNVLTGQALADLLEKVVIHLSRTDSFFPTHEFKAEEKSVSGAELSEVEQLGIHTCVRYGVHLRLLTDASVSDLTLLMKNLKKFFSASAPSAPRLHPQQECYPGHDWLACSVFLLMSGDERRSLRLLLGLASLLAAAFIWPAAAHATVPAESAIPPVYWCTAHYVEMLLKAEVPLVHSAFRMSGFTPSQMCLHWLSQCFWNYLDWTEICHYLSTCLVMGPDYQVYMCVALLKHLQPQILQHTQAQELQLFLKEEPVRGFRVGTYLRFMERLERSYRGLVLSDMRTLADPLG